MQMNLLFKVVIRMRMTNGIKQRLVEVINFSNKIYFFDCNYSCNFSNESNDKIYFNVALSTDDS